LNEDLKPDQVTSRLGLAPTQSYRAGEPRRHGGATSRLGVWLLSTEAMNSLDVSDHIDWLLDQVEPVSGVLTELRREGVRQDIFCYWATEDGQGGPALGVSQMRRLAVLELPVGFDVYRIRSAGDAGRSPRNVG
jgi:hypothetical protein